MTKSKPEEHFLYQFDVLRAVAIIGVFLTHAQYAVFTNFNLDYGDFFAKMPGPDHPEKYTAFFPTAFGAYGVNLFFMISGFLIHYITLVNGPDRFKAVQFFSKRFWRIYPPYVVALALFVFNGNSFRSVLQHPFDLLSHLFLVHNYSGATMYSYNGVFWSLAVEFQLYILYPLFLLARNRIGIRRVVLILLITSLATSIAWWQLGYSNEVLYRSVFRYWIFWAVGAWIAEIYLDKKIVFARIPGWGLVILCIVFYGLNFTTLSFVTAIYLACLIFAIAMEKYLHRQGPPGVVERLLIPVGLCSYTLYLIHMPSLPWLYGWFDLFHLKAVSMVLSWMVSTCIIFIMFFFISYSSYLFIETTFIKLGSQVYRKYLSHFDNRPEK